MPLVRVSNGGSSPYNMIFSWAHAYRTSSSGVSGGISLFAYDFDNDAFIAARRTSNANVTFGVYEISGNNRTFKCPYNGKLYYDQMGTSTSATGQFTTLTNQADYTANSTWTYPNALTDKEVVIAFVKT